MKYLFILMTSLMAFNSCSSEAPSIALVTDTDALQFNGNYNSLIQEFDKELLLRAAERPSDSGALGRNKDGYFHVRFQLNMTKLTDVAIVAQRIDALQDYLKTLRYSFHYQQENGGFRLQPPQELLDDPNVPPANAGDSVSAVAFFSCSLGLSLVSLENSNWYLNDAQTASIRSQIQGFDSKIELTLNYLKHNQRILRQVDQHAPNRLLFDAIAYYSLGAYLGDEEAKEIGIDFIRSALKLVDDNAGYFIEGGGWDSSYNGVALKLGLEVFTILPSSDIKTVLGQNLVVAMNWQTSRILTSGEISTEGNTRVFPGGEAFLGNEKSVDVEKTIKALMYFAILTENSSYRDLAFQVLDFYD